jgi:hypothetical protein
MVNNNNNKNEVLVYLHIEGFPENDPLPSKLGAEYLDQNVEAVAREILERAVENKSTYAHTAELLLQQMDGPEEAWRLVSFYKAKIPSTGKPVKVDRSTPLKKFITVERIGDQETNTSRLYLKAPIDGGYQAYSLTL